MDRRQFLFSGTTAAAMVSVPTLTLSGIALASGTDTSRLNDAELNSLNLSHRYIEVLSADGGTMSVPMQARVARRYNDQVYVWFDTDHAIRVFDLSGTAVGEIPLTQSGLLKDFGLDSYGNIFVLYSGIHAIQWLDYQGNLLGSIGQFGMDSPEMLNGPVSLTVDAQDNLHVLNAGTRSVKVFTANGVYLRDYGQSRWLSERRLSSIDGLNQIRVTGGMENKNHWLFSLDGRLVSAS